MPPRHRTFGPSNPRVPDHAVTTVFTYVTNDELYNSSLVCTAWAALAMEAEVWNWDGVDCASIPLTPALESTFKMSPARRFTADAFGRSPFGSPSLHPGTMLSVESPLRLHEALMSRSKGNTSYPNHGTIDDKSGVKLRLR